MRETGEDFRAESEMAENEDSSTMSPSVARRLLLGSVWAFGIKLIGLFGGLLVNAILARLLSTDEMGAYFLVISIAGFGAVLVRFGMQQTIVRFVAESVAVHAGGRARQTVAKVAGVVLLGSALAGLALFSGVGNWLAYELFDTPLLADLIGMLAVLVFVIAYQTVVSESFRGLHQIPQASLFDTVLCTLVFAFMLVLWGVVGKVDLYDVLLLFVTANVLSNLTGAALLVGRFRALPGGGNTEIFEILRTSAPLLVNNVSFYLISNAGLWVVGAYLPVSEVAVYGAVVRLVTLVSIPLWIVNMVVQPFIAEQNTLNRRGDLERVLRAAATLAGLPAVIILLVFVLHGDVVMSMIYGAPYKAGGALLAIFSLGHIVNVWTGACANVLIYTGHQKTSMGISLVSGSISLLAAVLLVQPMGAVGVALAMSVGFALQNLAAWWFARQQVGIWTHASVSIPDLVKAYRRMIGAWRK